MSDPNYGGMPSPYPENHAHGQVKGGSIGQRLALVVGLIVVMCAILVIIAILR